MKATKHFIFILMILLAGQSGDAQNLNMFSISGGTGAELNTAFGDKALYQTSLNPANSNNNVAIGNSALTNYIGPTGGGGGNVAVGSQSLPSLTGGSYNVALGYQSMFNASSAEHNVAIGYQTLRSITAANAQNVAVGSGVLANVTSGAFNTAVGAGAMGAIIGTGNNSAFGHQALYSGTTAAYNCAFGKEALKASNGAYNVGIGFGAAYQLASGNNNIFLGAYAGKFITSGSNNVIIGVVDGTATLNNTVIIGDGAGATRMYANATGLGVNLGTNTAPTAALDVNGAPKFRNLANSTTNTKILSVNTTIGNPNQWLVSQQDPINLYNNDGKILADRYVDMDSRKLVFDTQTDGSIYIGNTDNTPANVFLPTSGNFDGSYKLYVETGILTERIKVALRHPVSPDPDNWADYVFSDNYKLMPLREVEAFVKANKHLPGIESADELYANGLDLADMQRKQMEKIEELTLHLIAQSKTLEQQSNEIEELKAQVKTLLERK